MNLSKINIRLTDGQIDELNKIICKHKTERQIFLRAKIILFANQLNCDKKIATLLNVSRDMVGMWKQRWINLKKKKK